MAYFLQQIANAAPVAALYAALAFGYSIAFAVTRRADIGYGALFAFAAQMFVLFSGYGWDRLWLVLPAALGFGAAVALLYGVGAGLVVGRHVMRPLAFSSDNTVVVAALGIAAGPGPAIVAVIVTFLYENLRRAVVLPHTSDLGSLERKIVLIGAAALVLFLSWKKSSS